MTRRKLFQLLPLFGALPAVSALPKLPALDPTIVTSTLHITTDGVTTLLSPYVTFMTDEQVLDCCDPQLVAEILAKMGRRIE